MKLKSMQVKNFKCVEDSTQFDICPVTCLVGKNEAGKKSIAIEAVKRNKGAIDSAKRIPKFFKIRFVRKT